MEASLEDKLADIFEFIFGLTNSYDEHKDEQLLNKIANASIVPDYQTKTCSSRQVDIFDKAELSEYNMDY